MHLIIPDIHTAVQKVDRIISAITLKFEISLIILLGDYFDQWNDTVLQNKMTAEWLRDKLNDPKYVCLVGNHDFGYFYRHLQRCPGHTEQKAYAIRSILTLYDFKQLKTHFWSNGYLISHAGYSAKFVHPHLGFNEMVTQRIDKEFYEFLEQRRLHSFAWCGADRGGVNTFSGPLWADWWTFKGIPGVKQIVGHTNMALPNHDSYGNICLDTGLEYVGLLDAGKLTTLSTRRLCQ